MILVRRTIAASAMMCLFTLNYCFQKQEIVSSSDSVVDINILKPVDVRQRKIKYISILEIECQYHLFLKVRIIS